MIDHDTGSPGKTLIAALIALLVAATFVVGGLTARELMAPQPATFGEQPQPVAP